MEYIHNPLLTGYICREFWEENVPQVENWFITCAGTIYRARTIFLGGGGQTITHAIPNASPNASHNPSLTSINPHLFDL